MLGPCALAGVDFTSALEMGIGCGPDQMSFYIPEPWLLIQDRQVTQYGSGSIEPGLLSEAQRKETFSAPVLNPPSLSHGN